MEGERESGRERERGREGEREREGGTVAPKAMHDGNLLLLAPLL